MKLDCLMLLVALDYTDEDEFYDYEEYDSIVNGRRRASQHQFTENELGKKVESTNEGDDDYNYEYYEDDNGTFNSRSSKVEPKFSSQHFVNEPLKTSIQRRHSFSSINGDDEDYDDHPNYYLENNGYEKDGYKVEEDINQYAKAAAGLDPHNNYHITYDGQHRYYSEEEEKESEPNYQPFNPSHEDPFHPIVPSSKDFTHQGKCNTDFGYVLSLHRSLNESKKF